MHRTTSNIGIAVWLLLAATLLFSPGCRKSGEETYVARVGDATLTREMINTMRGDSTLDPQVFINNWIITELLYQEAERTGIAGNSEVVRRTEEARKRLAVAALLLQVLYSDTTAIPDSTIQQFYRQNSQALLLHEDVVNISYALFGERNAANVFRSKIIGGMDWSDALALAREDTSAHDGVKQAATRQYFTHGRLYPPELWKLAVTLPRGEASFVVKTDEGFCVMMVHSVQRQGQVPEFASVRNEVRDRLLIELRRQRYDRLVADLRAKATVDLHAVPSVNE